MNNNLPGVQYKTVVLADFTVHCAGPIETLLLLKFIELNPEPDNLIDDRLLTSMELTIGVKLDNHWKLQFPEQFDGIPFIFIEICRKNQS